MLSHNQIFVMKIWWNLLLRNKNLNFYPIFLPADNQKTPAINLDTANWTQNKKSGAEKWQKCLQEMVRSKSVSLYFISNPREASDKIRGCNKSDLTIAFRGSSDLLDSL